MRKIIFLLVVGFAIAGCATVKPAADKNMVTLSGKLVPMGMTTFQYGTHVLNVGKLVYALKSSKVDLKVHEGKDVIIKGLKVAGYPVDGGPDFIDVQEIRNK